MAVGSGTLVYSPDVRILVDRRGGKTKDNEPAMYDVSEDVISFTVTRRTNQTSALSFELNNKYRKYDRKLQRMARVVVWLKRVEWLQVFAGYLDTVPYYTAMPGSVKVEATCTLKRLENTYWDYTSTTAQGLMPGPYWTGSDNASEQYADGGSAIAMYQILRQVVQWDKRRIHIQRIPNDFMDWTIQFEEEQYSKKSATTSLSSPIDQESRERINQLLAGAGIIAGSDIANIGTLPPYRGDLQYALPSARGKISTFAGGPDGGAHNGMALTGWDGDTPDDQLPNAYYCAMRWMPQTSACYDWWERRHLAIRNERTGLGVIVQPADWGPDAASTGGRVLDLSRTAMAAMNGITDDICTIGLVADSVPYGPWDPRASTYGSGPQGGQPSASDPNGTPAGGTSGQNVQTVVNWQCDGHDPATDPDAAQADGPTYGLMPGTFAMALFIHNLCTQRGIPYAIISAYRDRVLTASGNVSNHHRGLAIDVQCPSGGYDTPEMAQLYNLLIPYAQQGAFRELIYKHDIWNSSGTKEYFSRTDHFNHLHMSTSDSETFLGNATDVMAYDSTETGVLTEYESLVSQDGIIMGSASSPFTIAWRRGSEPSQESTLLTGSRAWVNDEKVLGSFQTLARGSLRSFQSAPNGDFVAWFPDWFGAWGKTPVFEIRNIELTDLKFKLSDGPLATHVMVAGPTQGPVGSYFSGTVNVMEKIASHGMITVENSRIVDVMLGNTTPDSQQMDAEEFMGIFGLRPLVQDAPEIWDHRWELLKGVQVFMEKWTQQYSSTLECTFMPELYPGMRVRLVDHNIEFYVATVTHAGSRTQGFTTTAQVMCPMRNGKLLELELENH